MVERRSMSGIDLVVWVATLVAFPLAGLAGRAVAGPVDTVWTAALAGVIAGAVIGAAQWLALRRIGADLWWIVATAVGLAVGLALAFAIFGYGDTVGDLAVVGAVTGLGIGIAQWWLLRAFVGGGGHGTAAQAIVGLGGQVFMRRNSQDAVREFRPYFDNAPVYGYGPSLEEFIAQTPLTVGSPDEVIERTLGFRDYVGDYQRQLFLIDHAGLPLKTVLEQLDLLGGDVVPVLRKEFAVGRPAHVPDAPTHQSLLAAKGAADTAPAEEPVEGLRT
jgi:hypothetical protein